MSRDVSMDELVALLRETQSPEEREALAVEREQWAREGVLPAFLKDGALVESYSRVELSTKANGAVVESSLQNPQSVTDAFALALEPKLSTKAWGGEVIEREELAAWDDDPRLREHVAERFGYRPDESLTRQYARGVTGKDRWLRPPEYVTWKRRLLIEAGVISVTDVRLAPLPADVSHWARDLWAKIELLVQARALGGTRPREPLPLTREFLAGWAEMPPWGVRAALEGLQSAGLVRVVDQVRSRGGRMVRFWSVALAENPGIEEATA
jgi:hypothetical protein